MNGLDAACAICGEVLRGGAETFHVLGNCGAGPRNWGHNQVARVVHSVAHLSDAGARVEQRVDNSRKRPGDVLTTALPGGLVAIDVGIANPHAVRWDGPDACEAFFAYKQRQENADRCRVAGVRYQPAIWSAYGRPHAEAASVVRSMAEAAARLQGFSSGKQVFARAMGNIGAIVAERGARMAEVCFGREEAVERWLEGIGVGGGELGGGTAAIVNNNILGPQGYPAAGATPLENPAWPGIGAVGGRAERCGACGDPDSDEVVCLDCNE